MTGTFAGTGLLWNSDGLLFSTGNYITVPHSPLQNPTEITFFSVTIPNVQVAGRTLVGKGLGSGYRIVFNADYISIYDRGTTNAIDSPSMVYADKRYSIGIDMGALVLSIYINGKREATGGTTFLGYETTAEFRISNYSYGDYFKGDIKCLYMYGRILSPTEHQQLHLSPYQFIRPVVPELFFTPEIEEEAPKKLYVVPSKIEDPQVKPQYPCAVDWNHPLSRGLVGCWMMNEGGGQQVCDLINIVCSPLTNVSLKEGCANFDGTSKIIAQVSPFNMSTSISRTFITSFKSSNNSYMAFLSNYDTSSQYIGYEWALGNHRLEDEPCNICA